MSRMYPHTVTLWCRNGEDVNRNAIWRRRVIDGVRWTETRSRSGDMLNDEVRLLVPGVFSGYVDALAIAAGRKLGGAEWTLARGTRVAFGEYLCPEPPPSSLSIESCKPVRRGRKVDHFEATAK